MALACAFAVAGEQAGLASVLVDLDPQGTAAKWAEPCEAATPVVSATHADRLGAVLEAAREAGARLAGIDTAPHVTEAALTAANAADVVLIPCRPSAADLAAIDASIELARTPMRCSTPPRREAPSSTRRARQSPATASRRPRPFCTSASTTSTPTPRA